MKNLNFVVSVITLIIGIAFLSNSYAFYNEDYRPNLDEQSNLDFDEQAELNLDEQTQEAGYAEGQILIKLKEDINFTLQKTAEDNYVLITDHESVNNLNSTYALNIRLVFTSLMREHSVTGKVTIFSAREQAEIIKQKFPTRTLRAPKDKVIPKLENWLLIDLKDGISSEEALSAYQANPDIEYAQPNYIAKLYFTPNDPYYSSSNSWTQPWGGPSWRFYPMPQDMYGLHLIDAEHAWDISTGEGIIVAVIDTGLDYTHEDIYANVWQNLGEDADGDGKTLVVLQGGSVVLDPGDLNGIDDDNNGYIDDLIGWDFVGADWQNPTQSNNLMDHGGHGTHISGTIAAVGNNNVGVVGVSWQSKIMPVKGLDDYGWGADSSLAAGIHYAADNGADVLNNAWGPGLCPSQPIIEEAVRYAYNLGCVVIFAAGNSSMNVMNLSPQNMPEVITVAASDYDDFRAWWSNYGKAIDVSAPGVEILSLRASETDMYLGVPFYIPGANFVPAFDPNAQYYRSSGTSMACSYVAGLAALILSNHPSLNNEQVRETICLTTDHIIGPGSMEPGWNQYTGYGRINAYKALSSILYVPLDYPTIQQAIDAATSGQTVFVFPGVYSENISMKSGVDVIGENKDTTTITTNGSERLIRFENVSDCSFSSFTLTAPVLTSSHLIYINNSEDILISNNVLEDSRRGIFIEDYSSVEIRNNIIRNIDDPAITTNWSYPSDNVCAVIRNNIIESNDIGITVKIDQGSNISIINNIVHANTGYGIKMTGIGNDSFVLIKNNIVTSNYHGIYNGSGPFSTYEISYNNVWDNYSNYFFCSLGLGNISTDPMFVDPLNGNFQLTATALPMSPCIDAGDPYYIYNDLDGSRNDMGNYGGPYGTSYNRYRVVPTDYPTIQEAINAALPGDTVYVLSGTYEIAETIIVNKALTIKSAEGAENTIIQYDAYVQDPIISLGIAVYTPEAPEGLTLQGFTMMAGPWIRGIVILSTVTGPITVTNNIVLRLNPLNPSYGIQIFGFFFPSAPLIKNNIISGFYKGILNHYGASKIVNNTIVGGQYGIWLTTSQYFPTEPVEIKNCIIYNNTNSLGFGGGGLPIEPMVTYSDIQGGYPGEGNIDENPLFANPVNNNYYVRFGSPCIDAGDPNPIYNDQDGTRNDMGAYGGPDAQLLSITITYPQEGQIIPTLTPTITWNTSGIEPNEDLTLVISHGGTLQQYSGLRANYQRFVSIIGEVFDVRPAYAEGAIRYTLGTVIDLDVIVPNSGSYTVPAGVLAPNTNYTLELSKEMDPNIKGTVHFKTPVFNP